MIKDPYKYKRIGFILILLSSTCFIVLAKNILHLLDTSQEIQINFKIVVLLSLGLILNVIGVNFFHKKVKN